MCFQPPKEKAEEKTHAGLTTLFPGQKRRVSHLSKPGKEVRARSGDTGRAAGGGRPATTVWLPGPLLLPLESSASCPIHTACPVVPDLGTRTVQGGVERILVGIEAEWTVQLLSPASVRALGEAYARV